jgi:hypothetical protein
MAGAVFSELAIRSGLVMVSHVITDFRRADLGMYLNPNYLLIVFGQARTERCGMFHQRGGADIGLTTIPMLR